MTKVQIELDDTMLTIVDMVKAKLRFKNREDSIIFIIEFFSKNNTNINELEVK